MDDDRVAEFAEEGEVYINNQGRITYDNRSCDPSLESYLPVNYICLANVCLLEF